MGWLFGKKDDELYRGDAPATAPGVDGVEPSAYQSSPSSSTYVAPASAPYQTAAPYQTSSQYPTTAAPYQNPAVGTGQPYAPQSPVPPPAGESFSVSTSSQQTPTGLPPEFAAAWGLAQNQQRLIKKTLTRSLLGFLIPLILVGGLVIAGFVIVDKVEEGINPFSSGPGESVAGVVGTPAAVAFDDNSYEILISKATAQPGAAWGSIFTSELGFLVVELTIERTDSSSQVSQISWFDWVFTPDGEPPIQGALIAGGYDPLLSTLNLAANESATGLVAFETSASAGILSLTNFDGTWAQWPITADVPSSATGEFGAAVSPEAGNVPFSVVVANPRWVSTGDPAIWIAPGSGTYLVCDVSVTVDAALAEFSSVSITYDNWQFVPDGGTAVPSYIGVNGADGVSIGPGQATTAGTLIAFDTLRSPGTLNLVNGDGTVVASWVVPPL